jgi:hypothetical protein
MEAFRDSIRCHYYPFLYKTWSGILVDYVTAQSYDLDDEKM